jgi:hypothetical protein
VAGEPLELPHHHFGQIVPNQITLYCISLSWVREKSVRSYISSLLVAMESEVPRRIDADIDAILLHVLWAAQAPQDVPQEQFHPAATTVVVMDHLAAFLAGVVVEFREWRLHAIWSRSIDAES